VLDAQFFGVAQRRRRVFVVGHLGDWRPAAAVLFERRSLRRDTAPSKPQGKESTAYFESSLAQYKQADIGGTLKASGGVLGGGSETFLTQKVYETHPADSRVREMGETCQTVTSRWGTGGGNVPIVQEAYRKSRRAQSTEDYETWVNDGKANTINLFDQGDIRTTHAVITQAYSIREDAGANTFSATPLEVTPALQALRPSVQSHHAQTFIAHTFKVRGGCEGGGKGYLGQDEKAFTISTTQDQHLYANMAVRRLTPTECERLQGFPDGFTNIPWRKKDIAPDGLRYKALGNSMAVPVMQWIGDGIDMVDKL
jgi:DNA (cytosine-5)-methyltransferase 1